MFWFGSVRTLGVIFPFGFFVVWVCFSLWYTNWIYTCVKYVHCCCRTHVAHSTAYVSLDCADEYKNFVSRLWSSVYFLFCIFVNCFYCFKIKDLVLNGWKSKLDDRKTIPHICARKNGNKVNPYISTDAWIRDAIKTVRNMFANEMKIIKKKSNVHFCLLVIKNWWPKKINLWQKKIYGQYIKYFWTKNANFMAQKFAFYGPYIKYLWTQKKQFMDRFGQFIAQNRIIL